MPVGSAPYLVNNPCYLERGRKHYCYNFLSDVILVNNPCYLERGRKPFLALLSDCAITVNNPCYLERGRKHFELLRFVQLQLLITHVTSRGDGNFLFCIGVWKYRSVNNPCYLERGRKQFSHFIYLSFYIVNNPCYLERGRKL